MININDIRSAFDIALDEITNENCNEDDMHRFKKRFDKLFEGLIDEIELPDEKYEDEDEKLINQVLIPFDDSEVIADEEIIEEKVEDSTDEPNLENVPDLKSD